METIRLLVYLRDEPSGSQVEVHFPQQEFETLRRYRRFADSLESTILVRPDIHLEPIRLDLNDQGDLEIFVNPPSRKDITHALHEIRPLLLQREPTEFRRVRNIVSQRLEIDDVREYLSFLLREYEFRPNEDDPGFPQAGFGFGDALDTSTEKGLIKYLNALEFHRDLAKETDIFKGVGPNRDIAQQGILFALTQRAGVMLELADLCGTLTSEPSEFKSGYDWEPQFRIRRAPSC